MQERALLGAGLFATVSALVQQRTREIQVRMAQAVFVAVHDGYLIGSTLDPVKPQVLIYEPDGDKLRLVAGEWFVPVDAAGAARPMIFGKETIKCSKSGYSFAEKAPQMVPHRP